jgi:hypothetical protein
VSVVDHRVAGRLTDALSGVTEAIADARAARITTDGLTTDYRLSGSGRRAHSEASRQDGHCEYQLESLSVHGELLSIPAAANTEAAYLSRMPCESPFH